MRTKPHQLVIAVLLALILHGILFWAFKLPQTTPQTTPQKSEKIQVHLAPPKKQLVKIPPPQKEQLPTHADHMAEFNQQVLKQTQARNTSPRTGSKSPTYAKASAGKPPPHTPSLMPRWQDIQPTEGAAAFNDHLDESIPSTAETRLNTFEWKHAAYFNRIKDSVSRTWSPNRQIRRYDPDGNLIGHKDRLTVLEITLNPSGELVRANIKTPSGVFYLDDEAISAFKSAAPFPNPPKALFASGDSFSFTFGFYVNVGRGISLGFD